MSSVVNSGDSGLKIQSNLQLNFPVYMGSKVGSIKFAHRFVTSQSVMSCYASYFLFIKSRMFMKDSDKLHYRKT